MILILDIAALASALIASALWYRASRSNVRRLSHSEDIDHHDFNRLIVMFNRNQILNSRAALASAISALMFAVRFAAGLLLPSL